ncbi:MAG: hypothetical protein ONB44_02590 [candidate division KSB1 bacterium]|nr:hypothetical protein [candidate division KSB1 bacterium]
MTRSNNFLKIPRDFAKLEGIGFDNSGAEISAVHRHKDFYCDSFKGWLY